MSPRKKLSDSLSELDLFARAQFWEGFNQDVPFSKTGKLHTAAAALAYIRECVAEETATISEGPAPAEFDVWISARPTGLYKNVLKKSAGLYSRGLKIVARKYPGASPESLPTIEEILADNFYPLNFRGSAKNAKPIFWSVGNALRKTGDNSVLNGETTIEHIATLTVSFVFRHLVNRLLTDARRQSLTQENVDYATQQSVGGPSSLAESDWRLVIEAILTGDGHGDAASDELRQWMYGIIAKQSKISLSDKMIAYLDDLFQGEGNRVYETDNLFTKALGISFTSVSVWKYTWYDRFAEYLTKSGDKIPAAVNYLRDHQEILNDLGDVYHMDDPMPQDSSWNGRRRDLMARVCVAHLQRKADLNTGMDILARAQFWEGFRGKRPFTETKSLSTARALLKYIGECVSEACGGTIPPAMSGWVSPTTTGSYVRILRVVGDEILQQDMSREGFEDSNGSVFWSAGKLTRNSRASDVASGGYTPEDMVKLTATLARTHSKNRRMRDTRHEILRNRGQGDVTEQTMSGSSSEWVDVINQILDNPNNPDAHKFVEWMYETVDAIPGLQRNRDILKAYLSDVLDGKAGAMGYNLEFIAQHPEWFTAPLPKTNNGAFANLKKRMEEAFAARISNGDFPEALEMIQDNVELTQMFSERGNPWARPMIERDASAKKAVSFGPLAINFATNLAGMFDNEDPTNHESFMFFQDACRVISRLDPEDESSLMTFLPNALTKHVKTRL